MRQRPLLQLLLLLLLAPTALPFVPHQMLLTLPRRHASWQHVPPSHQLRCYRCRRPLAPQASPALHAAARAAPEGPPPSDLPPDEDGSSSSETSVLWGGVGAAGAVTQPLGSTRDLLRALAAAASLPAGSPGAAEAGLDPSVATPEGIDEAVSAVASYARRYRLPRTEGEERKRAKERAKKSPLGRHFIDVGEPEMYDNFGGPDYDDPNGRWLRNEPREGGSYGKFGVYFRLGDEEAPALRAADEDSLGDVREGIPIRHHGRLWQQQHFNKRALAARKRWEEPEYREKAIAARRKSAAAAKTAKAAAAAADADAGAVAGSGAGGGQQQLPAAAAAPLPPPRRKPLARPRGGDVTDAARLARKAAEKEKPAAMDEAALDDLLQAANLTAAEAVRAVKVAKGPGEATRRAKLKSRYADPQGWMSGRLEAGKEVRKAIWQDEEKAARQQQRAAAAKERWGKRKSGKSADGAPVVIVAAAAAEKNQAESSGPVLEDRVESRSLKAVTGGE